MLRRRLMSAKLYKYIRGGYAERGGVWFNNNLTLTDSPDGSKQFTVRIGFRITSSTATAVLAENWRTKNSMGWEIGVTNGTLYYKECYTSDDYLTTKFTQYTIVPNKWYDLKFWTQTISSSASSGYIYCSIDGGENYVSTKVARYESESSVSRTMYFGDRTLLNVDIRGKVGCTGVAYKEDSAGTIHDPLWDIETAPTTSDGEVELETACSCGSTHFLTISKAASYGRE